MKNRNIVLLTITLMAFTVIGCENKDSKSTEATKDSTALVSESTGSEKVSSASAKESTAALSTSEGTSSARVSESTGPVSSAEITSSAPISSESSSSENTSSSVDEAAEKAKQDAEMQKIVQTLKNLDGYKQEYTYKLLANGSQDVAMTVDDVKQSSSTAYAQKEIDSYLPGQAYYEYTLAQEGMEKKITSDTYIKEDDTEYLYHNGSSKNTKSMLSNGHIDNEGVFDLSYAGEMFNLGNDDSDYYTSFDPIKADMAGSAAYASRMASAFTDFFVMPEYTAGPQQFSVTFTEEEDTHVATVTSEISFKMNEATKASGDKKAVSESTCVFNAIEKFYYTDDYFAKTYVYSGVTLNGNDGDGNTFYMLYSTDYTTSFTREYDTADVPERADSYEDAPINTGRINLRTPEGLLCSWKDGELYDELNTDVFNTTSLSAFGISYPDFYLDKECTQKVTSNLTYKSYDQTVYAIPTAKEEGKVTVLVHFHGRETIDDDYSTNVGNNGSTSWRVYDIDAYGQVSFATWTNELDSTKFTVDKIDMTYTSDTKTGLIDGTKINVTHENYYYVDMYGTMVPSVS